MDYKDETRSSLIGASRWTRTVPIAWLTIFMLAPVLDGNGLFISSQIIGGFSGDGIALLIAGYYVMLALTALFGFFLGLSPTQKIFRFIAVVIGMALLLIPAFHVNSTSSGTVMFAVAYAVGFILGIGLSYSSGVQRFMLRVCATKAFSGLIILLLIYSLCMTGVVFARAMQDTLGGLEGAFEKCHRVEGQFVCYEELGRGMSLIDIDVRTDPNIQTLCGEVPQQIACWEGLLLAKSQQHLKNDDWAGATQSCNAQPSIGGSEMCCEFLRLEAGLPRLDYLHSGECLPGFPIHSIENARRLFKGGKIEEAVQICDGYVLESEKESCRSWVFE